MYIQIIPFSHSVSGSVSAICIVYECDVRWACVCYPTICIVYVRWACAIKEQNDCLDQ